MEDVWHRLLSRMVDLNPVALEAVMTVLLIVFGALTQMYSSTFTRKVEDGVRRTRRALFWLALFSLIGLFGINGVRTVVFERRPTIDCADLGSLAGRVPACDDYMVKCATGTYNCELKVHHTVH